MDHSALRGTKSKERKGVQIGEQQSAENPKAKRTHFQCHVKDDIRIYRNDPLICFWDNYSLHGKPIRVFLFYFLLFVGTNAALSYGEGTLSLPHLQAVVSGDVFRFPPFAFVLRVFASFHHREAIVSPNPPAIPFLRDYVGIIVLALMSAHMALVHKQWHTVSIGLHRLWQDKILDQRVFTPHEFHRLVRKYDRLFNLGRWRAVSLAVAIGLVLAVHYALWKHGIYSGLNQPRLPQWEELAYWGWWANPVTHRFAFCYGLVISIFLCYYMVRHNIVGVCAVSLCEEIFQRKGAPDRPRLNLNVHHRDGLAGLGILRDIMFLVYVSILTMGVSLVFIYYLLGTGTARVLVPFYLIFFLLNPLYVFLPLLHISKEVRMSKADQIEVVKLELARLAASTGIEAKVLFLERELEKLSDIPDFLFSPRRLGFFFVTYLIPVVLFVDWLFSRYV